MEEAGDSGLTGELARLGMDPAVTAAALEIDGILQRWRRRFLRREPGQQALADLGLALGLPELDVLMAVAAPASGVCPDEEGEETMVATVAARLGIDPSRASRLLAGLIRRGLVRRAASQRDGRRIIVALTPEGGAIVAQVRRYKLLLMGSFLQGWTAEERAMFLPLLERFSRWSEEVTARRSPALAARVAALAAGGGGDAGPSGQAGPLP